MSSSTLRILGYVAPALSAFAVADSAEAGLLGSALSSFGHSSPVQTVQLGGSNCYYAEGWNGRGWYQCGSEWNYGFGWIGPFNLNTFGASASRRHHRHGAVVSYPRALNPVYPRLEPPRRLGARVGRARRFTHFRRHAPGLHRFGAGGVPTAPNFRAGAATVSPSFAGGGFRGGLGGGNFHHFHGAGIPHTGAPVSPGFAGRRVPWAWRGGRIPRRPHQPAYRRAGLAGLYAAAAVPWAWRRPERVPHRRAGLARFYRRASLRRVSWRSGGRRCRAFPRRPCRRLRSRRARYRPAPASSASGRIEQRKHADERDSERAQRDFRDAGHAQGLKRIDAVLKPRSEVVAKGPD